MRPIPLWIKNSSENTSTGMCVAAYFSTTIDASVFVQSGGLLRVTSEAYLSAGS